MLLPRGDIWDGETFAELAEAMAPEQRRLEQMIELLVEESDPRTCSQLIDEWEIDWDLPTICTGPLETLQLRRNALVNRMVGIPDQSRQTYIDRADQVGYAITITEFSAGDAVPGHGEIPAADSAFAVQINASTDTYQHRVCGSPCGEPLATWGNELLECTLSEISQSHHLLLFAYT